KSRTTRQRRDEEEQEKEKAGQERHRNELRRARFWLKFVSAAAVILLVLLTQAFVSYRLAKASERESKAMELEAIAQQSLAEDPERSIRLAVQAVNATFHFRKSIVPAAEDTLHQAILSSLVRLTLRGHSSSVTGVGFSSDGKRLATASEDGTAKV